jgi:type I restriction enzyme S subunit
MEENQLKIPEGWIITNFGDKDLFRILGSGIKYFNGEKEYYSTSSIDGNKVLIAEQLITYKNRPSRANMQPIEDTVWFAKMKNTFKILKAQKFEINNVILSTGFSGVESQNIDCDYLMQILSSEEFNSQKNILAEGSTQEAVNNTKIKEIKFLLPESKAEQTQIAAILSKVDEAIAQTEQLIAKYSRIKTGLMQDLLTKGIDENGNIRSEETHEFKDSPLGRIPKEWECTMLGDIFDLKTGITPLRSNPLFFAHEGYNWIKTLDLNEGYLFDSEEKITDYALNKTAIKIRPKNTVLIAMYGGWQQIGRTSIIKSEAATNQAITALINPRIGIDSDFLQLFLQQNRWRWKQYAVSTRKDPNITKNDIAKFYVLYPKDITEQKILSNNILSAKKMAAEYSKNYSKLQSLKTGLMQDLLSGKVRVNHLIKETASV